MNPEILAFEIMKHLLDVEGVGDELCDERTFTEVRLAIVDIIEKHMEERE